MAHFSKAFDQSGLKAFTRSPLFQRNQPTAQLIETGESFDAFSDASSHTENNPDPSGYVVKTLMPDWSALSGIAYQSIDSNSLPAPGFNVRFRGQSITDPSSSWVTISPPPGAGDNVNGLIGIVNSSGTDITGDKPASPSSTACQTSSWLFGPLGIIGVAAVQIQARRGRVKTNRNYVTWVVGCEWWLKKSGGGYGWDNFAGRGYSTAEGRFFSVAVSEFTLAKNSFYEVPYPSLSTTSVDGTSGFADGFVGRFNVAIVGETIAHFNTRTGLSL